MDIKAIRRLVLFASNVGVVVCIVLLLNVTASNPTHRRYSSEVPLTTGQATGSAIGLDGEDILAKDLELLRNDIGNQKLCICSSATRVESSQCNQCVVSLPTIHTYRRPDFIGDGFIAEAKNRRNLLTRDRDFEQICDYADAAKALDVPLWLFVRVNTAIEPEYLQVVRSTGGDVVYYFAVPGYEDPTDKAARRGAVAFVIVGVIAGVLELLPFRRRLMSPHRPISSRQTAEPLNDAEGLLTKMKNKVRDE